MNNENAVNINPEKINAIFEPISNELKKRIMKSNGVTKKLPENLEKLVEHRRELTNNEIKALLSYSQKPEDWLEICFYTDQNSHLNHENLWISGLEKFSTSALYLENLGYFYFQKAKYHKSLEYLSRSHALENSFFALSLAIAAAYALTQYHLVLDYFMKLGSENQNKLNEDLLMKVATSALHQEKYDLSLLIFKNIQQKNQIKPLPDLKNFLMERFGSEKEMKAWSKSISQKLEEGKTQSKTSIDECITYASILIHEDKYQSALEYLTNVKEKVISGKK